MLAINWNVFLRIVIRYAMKISHSIQRRVFVIFGSFTLLLTLVYSGMNLIIAYIVEDEVLEKVLAYEAQVIESTFQKEGRINQSRVDYMKLYLEPNNAPKEIALAYKNKTLTSEVFTEDNVHYHIQHLYFDKDNSALLVAEVTPFLAVSNVSRGIFILFFGVFIVALFLSLWLAYKIAKKTTEPIAKLANEVMQQQGQHELITLSGKHSGDEIGFLASTIENALRELKETLGREADFNRDVSHELRTPLTVLNNTLALAETRTLTALDIKQMSDSGNRMNHIVSTLLAIAKADSIKYEALNLRAILEDCILSLHYKLVEKDFNIQLDVENDYVISANKQLLILLINNLIENAIEYASNKELLIQLKGDELLFENAVLHEIENNSVDHLTERNVRQAGSEGFGQGLYLVKRIMETLDWNFDISSDEKCYRFLIRF